MSRSSSVLSSVAAVLVPAVLLLCATAAPAGGRKEEQSSLERLRPAIAGVRMEVVDGDRFLALTNDSGKVVLVKGYDDEPYLRFLPSGVVQENNRSPSKYVNDDRFGLTPVPARANSDARPVWRTVSRNGTHRWFDHRTHSMEKGIPQQVTDPAERTRIFDWSVPMEVGGRPVAAIGTLTWVPAAAAGDGGMPVAAIAALLGAIVLVLAALAYLLSRRRRRAAAATTGGGAEPPPERDQKEVW